VCSGPHSEVRAYDPAAGRCQTYGPAERREVLVEVGKQLAWAEARWPLWPGDGLLTPTNPEEARGRLRSVQRVGGPPSAADPVPTPQAPRSTAVRGGAVCT
jgi:hypothetical protein